MCTCRSRSTVDVDAVAKNLSTATTYELARRMHASGWQWRPLPRSGSAARRAVKPFDWRLQPLSLLWYSGWEVLQQYLHVLISASCGHLNGILDDPIEHGLDLQYYKGILRRLSRPSSDDAQANLDVDVDGADRGGGDDGGPSENDSEPKLGSGPGGGEGGDGDSDGSGGGAVVGAGAGRDGHGDEGCGDGQPKTPPAVATVSEPVPVPAPGGDVPDGAHGAAAAPPSPTQPRRPRAPVKRRRIAIDDEGFFVKWRQDGPPTR